jgi:CHAT domain-containing protein
MLSKKLYKIGNNLKSIYRKHLIFVTLAIFIISITVSPVFAQIHNQSNALEIVRRAENLYKQGRFTDAIDKWKQAANLYAEQKNPLNQVMALSNLALTYQKLGNWQASTLSLDESLQILKNVKSSPQKQRIFAQTLEIQGQHRFNIGEIEQALENWQVAGNIYHQLGKQESLFANQVNQAQAMQKLGFYPRSCLTLLKAFKVDSSTCNLTDKQLENLTKQIFTIKSNEVKLNQIKGLHRLGNALRGVGNLEQSQKILLHTKELLVNIYPDYQSHILLSLGNTERALCKFKHKLCDQERAEKYYQQAVVQALSPQVKLEAIINQIDLYQDIVSSELIDEANKIIAHLPYTQTTAYAAIKLAEHEFCIAEAKTKCLQQQEESFARNIQDKNLVSQTLLKLNKIANNAAAIGDKRTHAYTLAMIGRVYEKLGEWQKGIKSTQQALEISQQIKAVDISYQIQWQLGRILFNYAQKQEAIKAYADAVNSLQTLRQDLVSFNPDIQYDFRESVEPVYRQYVDLLLQDNPNQDNLRKARDVIESLQLAELENFFREACVENKEIDIDKFVNESVKNNSPTAIFYAIVLQQRVEIILTVPQKDLLHYTTNISQTKLESILQQLQQELKNPNRQQPKLSQEIYDLLLREAEFDLAKNQIQTVVFVLDSYLRNIPMGVLDDGEKYLVEKYAIAYSPGLKLLQSQPLKKQQLVALSAGIDTDQAPSMKNTNFTGLPFVREELDAIKSQVFGEQLRNQDFTKNNFQLKFNQTTAEVIHLATHGNFSSNLEETFILAWDERINIKELEQLLRSRDPQQTNNIELLVLSACETAAGDKRAALGLAGVAVRSGARSTLATLWQVDDKSTAALMKLFYQELINNPNLSKAQALQKAQLQLLKFNVPHKWASVVLVGNWL